MKCAGKKIKNPFHHIAILLILTSCICTLCRRPYRRAVFGEVKNIWISALPVSAQCHDLRYIYSFYFIHFLRVSANRIISVRRPNCYISL